MIQTAVEWLENEILNSDLKMKLQTGLKLFALIKQSKKIEKEQIQDAYEIGFADAWDDALYNDEPNYTGAEQYYNETFKNTKQ